MSQPCKITTKVALSITRVGKQRKALLLSKSEFQNLSIELWTSNYYLLVPAIFYHLQSPIYFIF